MKQGFLLLLVAMLLFGATHAQTDSVSVPKHSPKRAALYSTFLPGLGQAYNKKYWKIPVVYAGFAATGYFFYVNNEGYLKYKREYKRRANADYVIPDEFKQYSDENIISLKEAYQRDRELALIVGGLWYVLNIIDAAVDAHLFYFDVSDNLSFRCEPQVELFGVCANNGIKLTLRF